MTNILQIGLEPSIASPTTAPCEDDVVIRESFASIDEGSEAKPLVVGSGSEEIDSGRSNTSALILLSPLR